MKRHAWKGMTASVSTARSGVSMTESKDAPVAAALETWVTLMMVATIGTTDTGMILQWKV
jgi:hypothetical protein